MRCTCLKNFRDSLDQVLSECGCYVGVERFKVGKIMGGSMKTVNSFFFTTFAHSISGRKV